jgi:hypothetical protein
MSPPSSSEVLRTARALILGLVLGAVLSLGARTHASRRRSGVSGAR